MIAAGVVAQYELALLLCQLGRTHAADVHLRALGYGWRLAPAIMAPRRGADLGPNSPKKSPKKSPKIADAPILYDHALPAALVAGLRAALLPEAAAFWSEHAYPAPNFFSYRYVLGTSANLIAEQAACALLPLVLRHWPPGAEIIVISDR